MAEVERAFRTCKSRRLEARLICVRSHAHTRAHVFVVMLAYLVVRPLRRAWADMDVTVEEGLDELGALSATRVAAASQAQTYCVPRLNPTQERLLRAAQVRLPQALPHLGARAVTRRKLPPGRTNP